MVDYNRRAALRGIVGLAAATAAVRTASAQDQKLPQATVQYQPTPKDGNECDKCVNWVAPNQCKIVAGDINPKGWCVAFGPKEG